MCFLHRVTSQQEENLRGIQQRKLVNLYGGPILYKQQRDSVINLSKSPLDAEIVEIMSLGMNCHLKQKFDDKKHKTSIEKLYYDVKQQETAKNIIVESDERIKGELKLFGIRQRTDFNKDVLTKDQYNKLRAFNSNPEFTVRKADKSSVFVVMDTVEYKGKVNAILEDSTKFTKIDHDPLNNLKRSLNSHISVCNAVVDGVKLPKLIGHYEPGYIYANPKIHKKIINPPMRPIVSQIGTPTAQVAQQINQVIVKYMPKKYMIESTFEFLTLVKPFSYPQNYQLASLDVENLFTNVPVYDTIDIILKHVYHHPIFAPPSIPKLTLKELLILCTTKTPFRNFAGDLFLQTDGVMMGSSLGPSFANFYMCELENKIFEQYPEKAPLVYARYVDDIFVMVDDAIKLTELKNLFECHSVLKFTFEKEKNDQLAFLDVLVKRHESELLTSVHVKSTNSGECINYNGICPERYKTGVIKCLLHRAFQISSNWEIFHLEINRIKQLLTNNNFPMSIIDDTVRKFLQQKTAPNENNDGNGKQFIFYFQSQMSSNYKMEERHLQMIIAKNVRPVNVNDRIKLLIYYKNRKLKNVLIKNNPHRRTEEFNVVYQYTCNRGECNSLNKYVGYTEQTLSERFRQHKSVQHHLKVAHGITRTSSKTLLESVSVLCRANSKQELLILEALCIKETKPTLNSQEEGRDRILRIF
jgi:hypothetical protein